MRILPADRVWGNPLFFAVFRRDESGNFLKCFGKRQFIGVAAGAGDILYQMVSFHQHFCGLCNTVPYKELLW